MAEIKNLIFDLGGVIIDLSVEQTLRAFAHLSSRDVQQVNHEFIHTPGFLDYETGRLDDAGFRQFVREHFGVQATDEAIDACWNAMLCGLPVGKLNLLKRLREHYQVFILSNTNNIHLDHIHRYMMPAPYGHKLLDDFVDVAYYSHRLGMRKPDADIYQHVLHENNLAPEATLFLDDNPHNVEAARALGIQTLLVLHPDEVTTYFDNLLN